MGSFGIYAVEELRAAGHNRREIARAVERGALHRIAPGWYAGKEAHDGVVRAIRAGGHLGCLSGCVAYRLWVPTHHELHVVYGRGARVKWAPGMCLHAAPGPRPTRPLWPVIDCLSHVAHRHDAESALIVLESALHQGLILASDVGDVLARVPASRRGYAQFLGAAESGTETRVRLFFARRHVKVTPQAYIRGIGRVDLLVGDRLIVECDSDEHHRSKEEHRNDRRRDLSARDLGYEVIRLTYHQVWNEWGATQRSLSHQLGRRTHAARR
ncbi:MAG: DUF559 domain-containing protein [Tessaracoccus sp.]|uniref:endonuclease domain-containing protein n=1 Tax=Tessaracoccus sp. TaxID=1971211 RepID=UPI001EC78927|nr:DUF559 domain-containing protein [Tessaracoccus sp.]MBK7821594.1 DUF559 domain-containing protein [Tessaracoccus sp.]